LANEINKNKSLPLASLLKGLAKMLGLLERDPEVFLKGDAKNSFDIDELISKRHKAKLNKDFKEADHIRSLLLENGVVLEDTPQGTIWRKE
jgi:cysteinyl-tRNA synthetase